jgi:hypothetical protein
MTASRPKGPGWYPDPDILPGAHGLRYWNGRQWTDRRRAALILTTLHLDGPFGMPVPRSLEGPVRTADLPAPAAEVSATRDAPTGLGDPILRPTGVEGRAIDLQTAGGGGRGTPPQPPNPGGNGGGGDGDGGHGEGRSRTRQWRKWWFFAAAAVIAALAVAFVGEALRPPSPGPRVLTDSHFVKLANDLCAKTLPNLRPPDAGPMGSALSPTVVAAQIDQAAQGLDVLANQLAALPAAPVDQPHIAGWLGAWRQYNAIGHQYAAELRSHPATGKAPPVLQTGVRLATTIDNFARANGLTGCEFSFSYNPDPSQF